MRCCKPSKEDKTFYIVGVAS